MNKLSDRIWDYIIKQAIPRTGQPIVPPHAPRTPAQLPQYGIAARARQERQQQQQQRGDLMPVKHRELVHDPKTGKVYQRTRTMYRRPGQMDRDPASDMQALAAVEGILGKILNMGLRQEALYDIDSLLGRFQGYRHGRWPYIVESLMQLRDVMKKRDWRTAEWIIQKTINMCKHARQSLARSAARKEQAQAQKEGGEAA